MTRTFERLVLLLGDVFFFYLALYVTLVVRYLELPGESVINTHVWPFSILFAVWLVVFYVAGLYDKQVTLLKNRLPGIIWRAQLTNLLIAAAFFFLVPYFSIAPKTNLFIYLVVSSLFIYAWRIHFSPRLGTKRLHAAVLIGGGGEAEELTRAIEKHAHSIHFVANIDPDAVNGDALVASLRKAIETSGGSIVVLDLNHPSVRQIAPRLYGLIFSDVRFVDMNKVYEDVFDKIPVSILGSSWSLTSIVPRTKLVHDGLKRIIDVIASVVLGAIALLLTPLVALAIKLDDGGRVFLSQRRIGQFGKIITVWKFRTMVATEDGVWLGETANTVTKVGQFLRATRIDELPQLWSILKGDLSLIGPRPDIEGLAKRLEEEIPYYNVRYLVKPGVTGWAQVKQDIVPRSVEETKERLAYDLYYLKYRSILLDISIALRTIKTIVSRSGK